MNERRYQPSSAAEMAGYPDPADYSPGNCPYCIDARHAGLGLGGCLRHVKPPAGVAGREPT